MNPVESHNLSIWQGVMHSVMYSIPVPALYHERQQLSMIYGPWGELDDRQKTVFSMEFCVLIWGGFVFPVYYTHLSIIREWSFDKHLLSYVSTENWKAIWQINNTNLKNTGNWRKRNVSWKIYLVEIFFSNLANNYVFRSIAMRTTIEVNIAPPVQRF